MASSSVGGLSGAFIPVSEDLGMIQAVERGSLTLEKLEAMTCVCSVGLDMIAVPGDTSAATISAILADEAAIGMINNKTTATRLIPVPGRNREIWLILVDLWDMRRLLMSTILKQMSLWHEGEKFRHHFAR